MRIRIALTIDLDRAKREADDIPPHAVVEGGAYIERAPERMVGFTSPEENQR